MHQIVWQDRDSCSRIDLHDRIQPTVISIQRKSGRDKTCYSFHNRSRQTSRNGTVKWKVTQF